MILSEEQDFNELELRPHLKYAIWNSFPITAACIDSTSICRLMHGVWEN
jgi:hypothetical protein